VELQRVALIDRDGTLNIDKGYLTDPAGVELIPGVANAVGDLKLAGFLVAIVSNQSAINRGMGSKRDVDATNTEVLRQLESENSAAKIDQVVYCPHTPEDKCLCRKPLTGMFQDLLPQFRVKPAEYWMFGDKRADIEFGLNLGLPPEHCFLVLTGEGKNELEKARVANKPIVQNVCADLAEAVQQVLKQIS